MELSLRQWDRMNGTQGTTAGQSVSAKQQRGCVSTSLARLQRDGMIQVRTHHVAVVAFVGQSGAVARELSIKWHRVYHPPKRICHPSIIDVAIVSQ